MKPLPKLYNVKMFAEKAEITHQYIYKALKNEVKSFPTPYLYVGESPVWIESQVENFIKERAKK